MPVPVRVPSWLVFQPAFSCTPPAYPSLPPQRHATLLRPCSVMPRDHLNYAATWWTLSAATLALAGKAIRQGVKAR